MKHFFYLLFFILISCATEPKELVPMQGVIHQETVIDFRSTAVHCLRDLITGEDTGGAWTIVTIPSGSILTNDDLDTDNPCLEFGDYGCGLYQLKYTVTTDCCEDFVVIKIRKRCCEVTAVLNCSI